MHTCIPPYIPTSIQTCIHTYVHTYICTCMHVFMNTHIHLCIGRAYACMCPFSRTTMCIVNAFAQCTWSCCAACARAMIIVTCTHRYPWHVRTRIDATCFVCVMRLRKPPPTQALAPCHFPISWCCLRIGGAARGATSPIPRSGGGCAP